MKNEKKTFRVTIKNLENNTFLEGFVRTRQNPKTDSVALMREFLEQKDISIEIKEVE